MPDHHNLTLTDVNAILAADYAAADAADQQSHADAVWTAHIAALHAARPYDDHPARNATGAHLIGTCDNSRLADDYARLIARDHTELHLRGTAAQLDRFHEDHAGCNFHIDRH